MTYARRWLLHPFVIGVYFVLTLAAANATALRGWGDLLWPLCISLAVSALCWGIGYALLRNPAKAALLGALWVVAFSVFGYVAETLRLAGTLRLVGGAPGLGGLFALAILGPSLAIHRTRRSLAPLNRYLTVVGALLVGYTALQLFRGLGQEPRRQALALPPPLGAVRAGTGNLPDIYLIVLDKYTGGEVLADHFGFDNGAFEALLRSRGFVVPKHARANYPQTHLALASMLNLDYVSNLPGDHPLHALVENNRLAAFLKLQGYRFVFFPTAFSLTAANRHADLQLPPPGEIRGELAAAWLHTTMLPALVTGACAVLGCDAAGLRMVPEDADLMDWKFERMKELAGADVPTFVLAHLSLPHEPYLYHADCTHREPYWPLAAGLPGDREASAGYLDQIRCANRKLAILVDSILSRSNRPPVILLQADHGHGRLGRLPSHEKASRSQLRERMSVFAAYLLPGVGAGAVSDSITPVNAVRLVLRHYFGADLPPLPDVSYWATEERPLDLVRVE